MDVIKPGHLYDLRGVDGSFNQTLQFVEGPADARVADGTTTEMVVDVLIDRLTTLNEENPSQYNVDAIESLKSVQVALAARTADRETRGVEGTNAA